MVNQSPGQTEYEFDWQNPDYVKPQYEVGRVISRTYKGILKQWKPIGLAVLCFILMNVVFTFLSFGILLPQIAESGSVNPVLGGIAAIFSILSFVFIWPGIVFVMIVTDAAVFSEFTNQRTTFKPLAKKALRKCVPLAFALILFFIAYYFGLMFFVIPGLLVYLGWGILGPVYVNEDVGLFASFGRSWHLMLGYKRWFFLSNLVIGLINSVIFVVFFAILMIPIAALVGSSDAFSSGDAVIITFVFIFYALFYLLMAVLTASTTTATYLEVKQLKEGAGHTNLVEVFT